jgi:hypothetical protein
MKIQVSVLDALVKTTETNLNFYSLEVSSVRELNREISNVHRQSKEREKQGEKKKESG